MSPMLRAAAAVLAAFIGSVPSYGQEPLLAVFRYETAVVQRDPATPNRFLVRMQGAFEIHAAPAIFDGVQLLCNVVLTTNQGFTEQETSAACVVTDPDAPGDRIDIAFANCRGDPRTCGGDWRFVPQSGTGRFASVEGGGVANAQIAHDSYHWFPIPDVTGRSPEGWRLLGNTWIYGNISLDR